MISVFSFFTILNSVLLSGFVAQIYSFSPFFRVSKRKLYFLTPTFYPLLPRFYSLTRVASCFASGRVRNHIPVPYIYYRYKEKTNLLVTPFTLKKSFFFFYPHTLTFYRNRLTDSDKECEGKCEGKFFTLTPPSYPHG